MKLFTAFIVSLLLLAGSLNAQARPVQIPSATQTEDQYIAETLYPATVLLYSQDESGSMKMLCTATAISHKKDIYEFATASHCASSDNKEEHVAIKNRTFFYISPDTKHEKAFIKAEVEGCGMQSRGDDFCIFQVTTDIHFPIVSIGVDTIEATEEIINVASPMGLGKQIFFGRVSLAHVDRAIEDDESDINWTDTMLLQLPGTNGGSSGSAIVCLSQRAICGFLVGTIGKTTMVAIPVSRFIHFRELLAKHEYKWYKSDDTD